jgi:hypothetical protein
MGRRGQGIKPWFLLLKSLATLLVCLSSGDGCFIPATSLSESTSQQVNKTTNQQVNNWHQKVSQQISKSTTGTILGTNLTLNIKYIKILGIITMIESRFKL